MSTVPALSLEELRTVDLFDDCDDAQLAPWLAAAETFVAQPGDILVDAGQEAIGMHLLLSGRLQVLSVGEDGRTDPEGEQVAPTWVGAIPSLTGAWHAVRMQAVEETRVARIRREPFVELVLSTRPVFDRVMRQMRPVISRSTERAASRERLAALGTMAAGLAHELNNPAAAARRASADLGEALDVFERMVGKIVEADVDRGDAREVVRLKQELLERARTCEPLPALEAADLEDTITDRLEAMGVAEPWKWAEPLAAACADEQWLTRVGEIAGDAIDEVVSWVAASLQAHTLTAEIAESTDRMSELVKAIKSYAFMDRGELVETDVHEGLDTTLIVLKHKIKRTQIQVVRDYDRTLPKITVHGSELNQVWTNLIDNAFGALSEAGGTGTITITTRRAGDCVEVDVADDGPGIPEELRARVFEPFFTTKAVGSGTGLGLDTARRIVTERHHGSLTVESRPGATVFRVRLPLSG